MDTERIQMTQQQAATLLWEYKQAKQFSTDIDREIQRTYRLIAAGKMVIKALESVTKAGLTDEGLPKLAIMQADREKCFCTHHRDGSLVFSAHSWARSNDRTKVAFPRGSFAPLASDEWTIQGQAIVPLVPLPHRPKADLANYSILWEADWRAVPKDPMLLRRLGKGDLWLVLAAWDLTEVERAALASRV